MGRLSWYWYRLRAMSFAEMALHARKKFRQAVDARQLPDWSGVDLTCAGAYPRLPKREDAPQVLREALQRDMENILAGRWKFFGHLELQVDDPPKWQCDYLVRRDLATNESAFKLNYRSLPEGVDSKLIWEPSRWYQLVRLAMAAYVLGDRRAGEKCVEWLEDWVKHNPPYRGWNWTSALEVGMRLIQFAWIDALLVGATGDLRSALRGVGSPSPRPFPPGRGSSPTAAFEDNGRLASSNAANVSPSPGGEGRGEGGRSSKFFFEERLKRLRRAILPPHVWYAWRHKSFGSSANNHLLGELAGCIVATVRWPGLLTCGESPEVLQRLWERQVLEQFGNDGGNKEQALNYQLFSWEFCWQAMHAISAGGRTVGPEVYLRLLQAGDFFVKVQPGVESWDYGDSDNAFVTPLFCDESHATSEWWNWIVARQEKSVAIDYWLNEIRGDFRRRLGDSFVEERVETAQRWQARYRSRKGVAATAEEDWYHFPESGQCVARVGFWKLRWDLSPLGYLATAAHGHWDALHLSIWWRDVALVIDPGTGAYHADKRVRDWLASGEAHNGPCPKDTTEPQRLGPFLWRNHHPAPIVTRGHSSVTGILNLTGFQVRRTIFHSPVSLSWRIEDRCVRKDGRGTPFTVRWQFAPGSWVKRLGERKFSIHRADVAVMIEVDWNWAEVELVEPVHDREQSLLASAPAGSLEGIVSPAFRRICWAPYLKLTAQPPGDKPCVFTTTFLASAHS